MPNIHQPSSNATVPPATAGLKAGRDWWFWRRTKEKFVEYSLLTATVFCSLVIVFMLFFIVQKALPVLQYNGLNFILTGGWDQQFYDSWMAGEIGPQWKFGALPLIAGTVYTTVGALIVAVILGLGCAIFIAELAPYRLQSLLESVIRLLAAIPSVIFGLVGLIVVVPFIQQTFISDELAARHINIAALDGSSLLAGIIVLSFMIMPIFTALAVDALRAVPRSYKEGALALGVSHWRTIVKLLLPVAGPGITAGAILAAGRAVGEAIALCMVSGSVAFLPNPAHGLVFFLEPLRSMASTIVDNAEGMNVPTLEAALFALGFLLLLASLALSLMARFVSRRVEKGVLTAK